MRWSWRLGRIVGIDLYVHFTFLFILAWVAWRYYSASEGDWGQVVYGLVLVLALFGVVVLHELGHALAARHYGIRTRDIVLLPIGGVARLERMPDDPKQELVVALAGPAVNAVLAAGLYIGLTLGNELSPAADAISVGGRFLDQMLWVNVSLAVFNLLPAFPMDGGRVLRALLAMRMEYVRATQVAARIGQGMALLFAFAGLFGNPFLIFIALFVWLAASQEASMAQIRSALDGIPVARVMITDFRVLDPNDSLVRAAEHVIAGYRYDFPVVEDSRLVGILTRNDLSAALARYGPEARVGDVMQTDIITAHPRDMLHTVFLRLQECDCHTIPIVRGGRLVGLVTADNLAEVLMMQEAMRRRRDPGRSADLADGRDRGAIPPRGAERAVDFEGPEQRQRTEPAQGNPY
jgi:Zn-dependent protease/CBS domain-containing protein